MVSSQTAVGETVALVEAHETMAGAKEGCAAVERSKRRCVGLNECECSAHSCVLSRQNGSA